ncbi:MAG: hypothetical protein IMF11_01710 [Proteobacteria bacterium]|nr:hypothetical protein [Pseudomonadota bacterium]
MKINRREEVWEVLKGEKPVVVPTIAEAFMDVTVVKQLGFKAPDDPIEGRIARADFLGNFDVCLGLSPGMKVFKETEEERVYQYETGAVWHESYEPTFCREAIKFPINSPEEAFEFKMPPVHWDEDIPHLVRTFKEKGYFVQGSVPFPWGSIYYYLTSFDNILMWMALEEEAAFRIFQLLGAYILECSERLLDAGVDAIFSGSDLGTGDSLLFSVDMFNKYVVPWIKKIADLCHQHGAILHFHSHGHIQEVMDGLIATGVDLLNPVGPSDHNDLKFFKEKWGHKITFLGGISTKIARMSEDEIESHVAQVMEVGCKGSRFMPRTESGIPVMEPDKARFYIDTLTRYRRQYGTSGEK